jgi:hypothetical protein
MSYEEEDTCPATTALESSHGAAVRPGRVWGVGEEGEWDGADEVRWCVRDTVSAGAGVFGGRSGAGRSRCRRRRRREAGKDLQGTS